MGTRPQKVSPDLVYDKGGARYVGHSRVLSATDTTTANFMAIISKPILRIIINVLLSLTPQSPSLFNPSQFLSVFISFTTNKNSIQEEIKSRLKLGNACYYSVQNVLSSSLLSKNLKIKIYRTIIFLLFCMGVKLGC